MRIFKNAAFALLVGLAAQGCVDLEVQNPNDADASRALKTPGDVESLIAGSFGTWWLSNGSNNGITQILNTVSYAHSATAANFGMVEFSGHPKVSAHADPAQVYYTQFASPYTWLYRSTASVVDGLRALEDNKITLPNDGNSRAKAYGYYVLGLAHGSASIIYDQGYIYDPSIPRDQVKLHPYKDVFEASIKYFDMAIAEATGKSWTIPSTWLSRDVTAAQLIQLANSYKARYRAAVARTPAERAAVNWNQVVADIDKGVTTTWNINMASSSNFSSGHLVNLHRFGAWGQLSYQVLGMADQSGQYQKWIAKPALERHPNLSADQTSDPFLIITPDLRFPRGTTIADQQLAANRGRLYELPRNTSATPGGFGSQWLRPDRGSFRWSYYRFWANDAWLSARGDYPEIPMAEMDLLRAEALLRGGNRAGAATLINKYRVPAGLNATDAAGTNTSCVPKLPNGSCGDLMEMLKWEMRLETIFKGTHLSTWYFHGRGWGDLPEGVFLHLPVPGREAQLLQMPVYTFGGPGGQASAPKGTYGY